MRNSSSPDAGLLWTALGGAALGLAAALLAMSMLGRPESKSTEAEVVFERSRASGPAGDSTRSTSPYEIAAIPSTAVSAKAACPGDERSFLRLFEDAHVRPTYQQRALLGVQIFGIKPGSFWETLGIHTGDLVVEMNHEQINSAEASVDLLKYLGNAPNIHLKVHAISGRDRQVEWHAPPAPDLSMLPEHCRS